MRYVIGWDMIIVSIDAGAQEAIFTHLFHMWTLCGRWDRLCIWVDLPIQKRLSDFREKCRITRLSRVFHGLTGGQQTPGFWGVTEHLLVELQLAHV